jgi:hypothetical protein
VTLIRRLILALALAAGIAPAFAQAPPPVPSLPDTERRTSYSVAGTTCACAVNFALYGDATDYQNWIEVYLNGALVNYNDPTLGWVVTSPTGPLASIARPITDAVLTFNSVQTGTVQIVGARRPRRTSQFNESTGVPARNLNQALTDIIAQNREVWDKINDVTGRALISQPGNVLGLLPVPSACSGKFLSFDVTGLIPQCLGGGAGSGNVTGPASSVTGTLAVFANTTGQLLADGPIPVRAGDIFYWNGTQIVTLPGNNSGTQFLSENASGVPSWATAAGSTIITPSQVNLICYVDGIAFTTLASAVSTCSSNRTIIVPSAQSISANITISGNGVLIKCENNAILTYSANISISFTGTDDAMEGCNLAGPGTGTSTSPPIKFSNIRFAFRRNVVSGFGSTSLTGIISGTSTGGSILGADIEQNNINSNNDFGIDIGGTGIIQRIRILNNYVGNGVFMIPGAGATPNDINVSNNILDAGSAGFTNPVGTGVACIQILGGNSEIFDLVTDNNACHLEGSIISAGSECWGVGGINRMTAVGNTCDPRGFTYPIAYELNQVVNFTFVGNQSFSGGTASHGIYAENPSFGTIANNPINGFGTATTDAGIDLLLNTASLNMQSVSVTGNPITFATGGAGQGIAVRCNLAATCSDFTVANNPITSDGTASSIGIYFNYTAGTATSAAVTGNSIRGPVTGIKSDASWNDVCTGSNTATASGTQLIAPVTTSVSIGTAATHCH